MDMDNVTPPPPEGDGDPAAAGHSPMKKAWTKPVVRPLYSVRTVRSGQVLDLDRVEGTGYRHS